MYTSTPGPSHTQYYVKKIYTSFIGVTYINHLFD